MAKKNSLRVGAGERYAIEVNDRGEICRWPCG